MRILSLQPFLKGYGISPWAGGKDKAALEVCRALILRGHEVDVLPVPWGTEPVANEPYLKDIKLVFPPDDLGIRALPTQVEPDDSEMRALLWRVLRSKYFWRNPWRAIRVGYSQVLNSKTRALASALKRYRYDLIIVHQSGSDIALIAKEMGCKIPMLLIHHSGGLSRYVDTYDYVVFVSNYQREWAVRAWGPIADKSTAINYWIDSSFMIDFDNKSGKDIGFIGLLDDDRKGLDVIIAAFLADNRLSGLTVHVVGDGRRRVHWESVAVENGLPFVFYGRQSGEEVAQILSKCSLYVMPSRSEGFALAYLEALSLGARIIGYNNNVDEITKLMGSSVGRGYDHGQHKPSDLADMILEEIDECRISGMEAARRVSSNCRDQFGLEAFREKYVQLVEGLEENRS